MLAAVECKKPRRKGTDVKNKCAARGVVTVITLVVLLVLILLSASQKVKNKTKMFNHV